VKRYIAERQAGGASNGTVNRELAVLGRMLRLAYENGKLMRLPLIHKLKEAARKLTGTFSGTLPERIRGPFRNPLFFLAGSTGLEPATCPRELRGPV
jgi:hypothetical protein